MRNVELMLKDTTHPRRPITAWRALCGWHGHNHIDFPRVIDAYGDQTFRFLPRDIEGAVPVLTESTASYQQIALAVLTAGYAGRGHLEGLTCWMVRMASPVAFSGEGLLLPQIKRYSVHRATRFHILIR